MQMISVYVPAGLYSDLKQAAEDDGASISAYMRRALNFVLRRGVRSHEFAEVQITRRGDSTVESYFEVLAAKQPLIADIAPAGHAASRAMLRMLKGKLSATEVHRIQQCIFEGRPFSSVAIDSGVSKQAVQQSVAAALAKVRDDDEFLVLLCSLFPDSALTPEHLRALKPVGARGGVIARAKT